MSGGFGTIKEMAMTQENKHSKAWPFSRFLSGISRRRFLRLSTGGMTGGFLGHLLNREEPTYRFYRTYRRGENRARLRELGIVIGRYPPGPYNTITDVKGVRVGHCTKIRGSGELRVGVGPVRTGVTVIMPHEGNVFEEKLAVGHFVLNGNGEMTGFVRNREVGTLETPIFLTGTANIGIVYDAALTYLIERNPDIGITENVPVPVVAECWDAMGDTEGRHITEQDVLDAIKAASGGPVPLPAGPRRSPPRRESAGRPVTPACLPCEDPPTLQGRLARHPLPSPPGVHGPAFPTAPA